MMTMMMTTTSMMMMMVPNRTTAHDHINFNGRDINSSMLAEFLVDLILGQQELLRSSSSLPPTSSMTSNFLKEMASIGLEAVEGDLTSSIRPPMGGGARMKNLRPEVTIPLYSLIFLLSVTGNTLVVLTLLQNRSMRTVTNIFLLNLAVSDLLLASFCMPFTLVPTLMQDFVFGHAMCIMVRYIQGIVVGVTVFTHVTISLERYFAICQPLKSRRWQTKSHCYKTIALVWILSSVLMVPTAASQRLVRLKNAQKCMEYWANQQMELIYAIVLDLFLLVLPLVLMLAAYGFIAVTLFKSMRRHNNTSELGNKNAKNTEVLLNPGGKGRILVNIDNKTFNQGRRNHSSLLRRVLKETSGCRQKDTGVSSDSGRPQIIFSQERGSVCIRFNNHDSQGRTEHNGKLSRLGRSFVRKKTSSSQQQNQQQHQHQHQQQQQGDIKKKPKSYSFINRNKPNSIVERGNYSLAPKRHSTPQATGYVAASNTINNKRQQQQQQLRIGNNCSNNNSNNRTRRRSVLMLFVVVTEFFVCWTPLYVVWTWSLLDQQGALERVSPLGMNLIHLLAFVSSCCNPITYCFMSKKFRQGFFTVFGRCCRRSSCGSAGNADANGSMALKPVDVLRSSFRSSAPGAPVECRTNRNRYLLAAENVNEPMNSDAEVGEQCDPEAQVGMEPETLESPSSVTMTTTTPVDRK